MIGAERGIRKTLQFCLKITVENGRGILWNQIDALYYTISFIREDGEDHVVLCH